MLVLVCGYLSRKLQKMKESWCKCSEPACSSSSVSISQTLIILSSESEKRAVICGQTVTDAVLTVRGHGCGCFLTHSAGSGALKPERRQRRPRCSSSSEICIHSGEPRRLQGRWEKTLPLYYHPDFIS